MNVESEFTWANWVNYISPNQYREMLSLSVSSVGAMFVSTQQVSSLDDDDEPYLGGDREPRKPILPNLDVGAEVIIPI